MFDEVVFGKSNCKNIFLDFSRKRRVAYGLCRGIKQNEERFFLKLHQGLMSTVYFFHSANSPTLKFEHCRHKKSFLSAMTEYITKAISVIDKSKLFCAITIIGKTLSPINYRDKCPSLCVRRASQHCWE